VPHPCPVVEPAVSAFLILAVKLCQGGWPAHQVMADYGPPVPAGLPVMSYSAKLHILWICTPACLPYCPQLHRRVIRLHLCAPRPR
jgi:hypothetical protein